MLKKIEVSRPLLKESMMDKLSVKEYEDPFRGSRQYERPLKGPRLRGDLVRDLTVYQARIFSGIAYERVLYADFTIKF